MFKIGDKVMYVDSTRYGTPFDDSLNRLNKKDIYTVIESFNNAIVLLEVKSTGLCGAYRDSHFRKIITNKSAIKELVEKFVEIQERIDVEQPVEV